MRFNVSHVDNAKVIIEMDHMCVIQYAMVNPHCFRKYGAIIGMRYYMSEENTELSNGLKTLLTSFRQ